MSNQELPVKAEVFPYRRLEGGFEFLLLKRVPRDGGFWQPITGTLEFEESLRECALRELEEEAGIPNDKIELTPEIYRFAWQKKDFTVVELVYGGEVSSDRVVTLSDEHDDFKWLKADEVLSTLKMESNKEAFLRLRKYLSI